MQYLLTMLQIMQLRNSLYWVLNNPFPICKCFKILVFWIFLNIVLVDLTLAISNSAAVSSNQSQTEVLVLFYVCGVFKIYNRILFHLNTVLLNSIEFWCSSLNFQVLWNVKLNDTLRNQIYILKKRKISAKNSAPGNSETVAIFVL